jgi:gamma-polyglutamate synthase
MGPELRAAKRILAHEGPTELLRHAVRALEEARTESVRLDTLRGDLAANPGLRRRILGGYLAETVRDSDALRSDLRALAKDHVGSMDVAAMAERVARKRAERERTAETSLALLHAAAVRWVPGREELDWLLLLARWPGQWSRRLEALRILRRVARGIAAPELTDAAWALAGVNEHHWVQPAAIALLAAANPEAALDLALSRLKTPGTANDLLVRERIVALAAQGIFRGSARRRILAAGSRDPSDHVRIAAARAEEDPQRLHEVARLDISHKVRATALLKLAKRSAGRARTALIRALRKDHDAFVVMTAAEVAMSLVRRHSLGVTPKLLRALAFAGQRPDITENAKAAAIDALAAISVLASPRLRPVHDRLEHAARTTELDDSTWVPRPDIAALDDADLGLVLAILNRDDAPLGVDRKKRGLVLYRGEPRRFAVWRLLHELLHPAAGKRQAFSHTSTRVPTGTLRAPPGGMAETTRTMVPGERVLVEPAGGWGRHLPRIGDLVSMDLLRPRKISLVVPAGTVLLEPPPSLVARVRAWCKLTLAYRELDELRSRSLQADDPEVQCAYAREVLRATGIKIDFVPHVFGAGGEALVPPLPRALPPPRTASEGPPPKERLVLAGAVGLILPGASGMAHGLERAQELWRDLAAYATSSGGNRLSHLGAYAVLVLLLMTGRAMAARQAIEHDRDAIPLVIGGWGTRGKSGTERLKAALFQGLGHECLVKTTGCEAMFIHAIPGAPAREIFLYRPYDKSTVWEQRTVLRLARQLGVRVFLYECMALQPDLVRLIQRSWMRDDYSTITNAHPDHEDVQGPTGLDVADVISEFVPTRGKLFTSEDQMLPVLRDKARARGTIVRHVGARSEELVADDLLARFPYQEHPRNIALVGALARSLGVPRSVAIAEMADNVVPDLGVLKTYPPIEHLGRSLRFTNGMSANERMGALSNWLRCGFDQHDPDRDPSRWIVTVVNNRADRPARSEVFARFIVEDVAARRHFLIGTNVRGLSGLIRRALRRYVDGLAITGNLPSGEPHRSRAVRVRVDAAFRRLLVGRTDTASVREELTALGWALLPEDVVERLLAPSVAGESLAAARRAVDAALPPGTEPETRPFLVDLLARRRVLKSLHLVIDRCAKGRFDAVDAAFARAYTEVFESQIVPLVDPELSGDEIIDAIARHAPPGAKVSAMGLQNIKGTGLDFVYRWVSIDKTVSALHHLWSAAGGERERALERLMDHEDYGRFDATMALDYLLSARDAMTDTERVLCDRVIERLGAVQAAKASAGRRARRRSPLEAASAAFVGTFDHLAAVRRHARARGLMGELVRDRVSRASAALAMRELVKQKGH